ncbi:hypothetical protein Ancab_022781 [Ancistrocladus abbreviatus]
MLMEHTAEDSHGTEIVKNSRSLDLQSLYDQKLRAPVVKKSVLKRKHVIEDEDGVKKRSKKEVFLSSLSSRGKSRKSLEGVGKGVSSSAASDSGKLESGSIQKWTTSSGSGGIALNLSDNNVCVPKRKRDLVRRKKFDIDHGLKQEAVLNSKETGEKEVKPVELAVKLNGSAKESIAQNGDPNGKFVPHSESNGNLNIDVLTKVKSKKKFDGHKGKRSNGFDLLRHLKKEDTHSTVHSSDLSSKKARKGSKKRKECGLQIHGAVEETSPVVDKAVGICEDFLEEDEENLEANAARMLSSRFDPSCTGFCSSAKSSKSPSANGLSYVISSSGHLSNPLPTSLADSDSVSGDNAVRVLRPRDQHKRKGLLRKRRHFYEVLSQDFDSHWVLNRRIKVFWPLDQSWYIGHVIGYDPEKKLHHIKYDDRDEEWIDLQTERFKLLLLPSEAPSRSRSKRRRRAGAHSKKEGAQSKKEGANSKKGKRHVVAADDGKCSNYMDSEPIISWLARSTRRVKSSSCEMLKKQEASNHSEKFQSLLSAGKNDTSECLHARSSESDASKLVCKSALLGISDESQKDMGSLMGSPSFPGEKKSPIVYFRRRFRRREQGIGTAFDSKVGHLDRESIVGRTAPGYVDSLTLLTERSQAGELCDLSLGWLYHEGTDDPELLKLSLPSTNLSLFRFELCIPISFHPSYSFAMENLWLFHALLMLHHGTVATMWPTVHLEMLFVDNIVGLRFILFEGCLRQAVTFVFLVLAAFQQSIESWKYLDAQLPITSIRFKFSFLQDLRKQLVFAFYNFSEVKNSKWFYLDRKLKRSCLLAKELPPSECTYDNIKALESGPSHLSLIDASGEPSSRKGPEKILGQRVICFSSRQSGLSGFKKFNALTSNRDEKLPEIPPFALSFTAAPTFFIGLHLKMLMERSISCVTFEEHNSVSLAENPENDGCLLGDEHTDVEDNSSRHYPVGSTVGALASDMFVFEQSSSSNSDLGKDTVSACTDVHGIAKVSHRPVDLEENETDMLASVEKKEDSETEPQQYVLSQQALDFEHKFSSVKAKTGNYPVNGLGLQNLSFFSVERTAASGTHNGQNSADLSMADGVTCSPCLTAPGSMWHQNMIGSSVSPLSGNNLLVLPDSKPDFISNGLGNGPKKPRTQVSYSLPMGGHGFSSKNRSHHSKGFSHKRIRRASEKRSSDALRSQRNVELSSCDANVLVTIGDRGWREFGARIVLELFDQNEWRLAVKLAGTTKYSYKAHQFLQPGSTNRYTHAMMWKGGKDWILEFPDRVQWTLFKEMHEECYNRNMRAALVKNIPIPGVRLIEESDDNGPDVPFVRPSSKYLRQVQSDVDMAMDPSRVLYDMDSDDELWISKIRSSDVSKSVCDGISNEMFEKIMDKLEKAAYAKQCDHFTVDELKESMIGVGKVEAIEIIYQHWWGKRQKKGLPLIRHLQPPLWEKYQQQVKEWELAMMKSSSAPSNGSHERVSSIEKPPMFAFCLKPRGLVVPNKGLKQRSQKKLPVPGQSNLICGDLDPSHSFAGRRLNGYALGDDKVLYVNHNHGLSDSSPLLQASTRVLSPRDAGPTGYFSLSGDTSGRNYYPKLYRNKWKKVGSIFPPNDSLMFSLYNQRFTNKRNGVHGWNMRLSECPSQTYYQLEGSQRLNIEQLDASDLDEFRLRDASGAAQHAMNMAKLKREKAQRLLYKADLAIHKAVVALMTAEALKAASEELNRDG